MSAAARPRWSVERLERAGVVFSYDPATRALRAGAPDAALLAALRGEVAARAAGGVAAPAGPVGRGRCPRCGDPMRWAVDGACLLCDAAARAARKAAGR